MDNTNRRAAVQSAQLIVFATTRRISSPYCANLFSPIPLMPQSAFRVRGLAALISASTESWKITKAGSPCSRAREKRQFFKAWKSAGSDSARVVVSTLPFLRFLAPLTDLRSGGKTELDRKVGIVPEQISQAPHSSHFTDSPKCASKAVSRLCHSNKQSDGFPSRPARPASW